MSQNRVNKILIGKEISRTASLILYGTDGTVNLAEGEVVVLDKNQELLAAGSTVADTDTIYIAVGTGDTYDYTNPAGTAVTGVRKMSISAPIKADYIKKYVGLDADAAATQRVATIALESTAFAPVVATEYVIRVVYRDISEHPGQFVQSWRYKALTTTPANLVDAFQLLINGDPDARIVASEDASNDLVLTGKVIPANSIDDYSQVDFEVTFFSGDYVVGANEALATIAYSTQAHPGNGNPYIVRDREKKALGYEGVTNTIHFPVVKPDASVDLTKWYDTIIIESDVDFVSADNQYVKRAPVTTEIYIPDGASQETDVLAVLNPWMASAGFEGITL